MFNLPEIFLYHVQGDSVGVQLECLDILCDLLTRFGGYMLPYHTQVVDSVLPQLVSPRCVTMRFFFSDDYC